MLTHAQVWQAVDRLAERHGLSTSGLARKAGLDSTAFNPSKRRSPDGRPRWPSTESIAKVLAATGASLDDFMGMMSGAAALARPLPLIGFAQAGTGGFFDDAGLPSGSAWEEVTFPQIRDEHAFALEITGDSMLPLYRNGDVVVVSPLAALRRGDRVIVKTREGEVMAKELRARRGGTLVLGSLNPAHPERTLRAGEVDWIARVLWVSQ